MTRQNAFTRFIEVVFRIFLLISGFIGVDLIYHYIYENNFALYAVPVSYFFDKLVYGVPLGIVGYYVVNNLLKLKYSYNKTSIFSLIIVLPLGIRYFTIGHFTTAQNIVVTIAHYFMIETLLLIYYKVYNMDYIG